MKKLLIVVDYQNDFVSGALGFEGADALDEPICAKIEAYRSEGADVVYTLDTHGTSEEYLATSEGRNLPVPHCERGSHGWQLFGRTAELLEGARCFEKPAFGCVDLIPFLREGAYDQVELCGLVSNICVISNAVIAKAALPESQVIVDAACTSCFDAVANEEALRVMEGVQITVLR